MAIKLDIDEIIDRAMDNVDIAIEKAMDGVDRGLDALDKKLDNLPKGANVQVMKDGNKTKITINGREYTEDDYGNIVKLPFNMFWLIGKIIKYSIIFGVIIFLFSMFSEFVTKTKYEVKTLNPPTTVEQPTTTTPTPTKTSESLKKL
jgi:hypothetical protein